MKGYFGEYDGVRYIVIVDEHCVAAVLSVPRFPMRMPQVMWKILGDALKGSLPEQPLVHDLLSVLNVILGGSGVSLPAYNVIVGTLGMDGHGRTAMVPLDPDDPDTARFVFALLGPVDDDLLREVDRLSPKD